uniref:Uncharacterized protein n=2 Tax=Culex tarsalis TaxID=7177 RepID=A0A1Q3EY55_CULTA
MERFISAPDSYYNPECPVDSDDEEEPLGGWNPVDPTHHDHPPEEEREPIPAPSFTEADLYPTTTTDPDPECSDPEWPLARYWPVYVSNFRLDDLEEERRNAQVASFFAAKGLLTRMIFIREPEDCHYYRAFQRMALLLDMLVYFTRAEDAVRAIRLCHRSTYHGHRLNVWPGRKPVFFDRTRSIGFATAKNFCAEKSETAIELMFQGKLGPCVETVARFNLSDVVVEFLNEELMKAGIRTARWFPKELTEPARKQRFLEQDVEAELLTMIADKPGFMDTVPPKDILGPLLEGKIPAVDKAWENVAQPRPLPESTVGKYRQRREHRVASLKRNHERKRREGFNVLLDGAPQAKKQTTVKQVRALVQQEVDRLLGEGPSAEDRFRHSMLAKNHKYCNLRLRLLNGLKQSTSTPWTNINEMFYEMLAMEEKLMDLLPQAEEYLGCLRLEIGLTKAVLVADECLPFPKLPSLSSWEQSFEDESPPGDNRTIPENVLAVRPYSEADFNPSQVDPSCDDPEWPLASFWPVYVDNFRINTLETEQRNDQIREYFAAKGLLATIVFVNESSHFYKWFQRKFMLLDMLVYFTSREDAQKAIELCHRDSYYGHYLNVFPGREPVLFDVERSGFTKVNYHEKCKRADHPTEPSTTYIEENVLEALPKDVTCVTRSTEARVHFEFAKSDLLSAVLPRIAVEFDAKSGQLKQPLRKQRFLELDMKNKLTDKLRNDPAFLRQRPSPDVLRALFVGTVPGAMLNWNWFGWNEPRKPGLQWKLAVSFVTVAARMRNVLRIWCELQEDSGLI